MSSILYLIISGFFSHARNKIKNLSSCLIPYFFNCWLWSGFQRDWRMHACNAGSFLAWFDSQDSLKIFYSCYDIRHDASIQHRSARREHHQCVHVLKVNFDVNLVINESKKRATSDGMSQVHLIKNWETDSNIFKSFFLSLDVHCQYIIFIARTERYKERVVLIRSADIIMFLYGGQS